MLYYGLRLSRPRAEGKNKRGKFIKFRKTKREVAEKEKKKGHVKGLSLVLTVTWESRS